jgi:amidase
VPFTGAATMDMTLEHLGPMTRTVADNALMLEVMAGPDGLDRRQTGGASEGLVAALKKGVRGLPVGILAEGSGHAQSEPEVDAAVRNWARSSTRSRCPLHKFGMSIRAPIAIEGVCEQIFRGNGVGHNWRGLYMTSFLEAHSAWRERANMFPEGLKLGLLAGDHLRTVDRGRYYAKAQNLSRKLRAAHDGALERHDVRLLPTVPVKGFRLPPRPQTSRSKAIGPGFSPIANTGPFNVSGQAVPAP